MTKLTKSNLDFRNPPKKVKDNPSKQLTHRPTMTAHQGAKPGDPKYGTVDQVRTVDQVNAELDRVNTRIANFSKEYDDPRRYATKKELPSPAWKEPSLRMLERRRDALVNELTSLHSSQEYESKPMSGELTYLNKAATKLQRQIDALPKLWGDKRAELAVARARKHLEDLQELIGRLMITHQPYGDAEVADEIQHRADALYAEWQRSKDT